MTCRSLTFGVGRQLKFFGKEYSDLVTIKVELSKRKLTFQEGVIFGDIRNLPVKEKAEHLKNSRS